MDGALAIVPNVFDPRGDSQGPTAEENELLIIKQPLTRLKDDIAKDFAILH